MADKLDVQIVTGERVVLEEHDVDMVVAPGGAGVLGILPEHAPLVTTLASGEMRIKKGANEQSILVFGGFMEVADNKVLILADTAERVEELDLARAEEARRNAESSIANRQSTIDLEDAQASLRRANLRLRVGQKRGVRRAPDPATSPERASPSYRPGDPGRFFFPESRVVSRQSSVRRQEWETGDGSYEGDGGIR
jgi:F-type H+-transporting ATPase subunit epsilon